MKNDDRHCTLWSKKPVLRRSTMKFACGILLDQKFLCRSVHAAFVNEVVRGVVGAHPPFGPRSSVCSRGRQTSLVTPSTQDILVMTQLLFRVCVVVLSLVTSRWVAAAVAGSARSDAFLLHLPSPDLSRRRGESFVGVSVHHSFGCLSFLVCKATPLLLSFFVEQRHQ